MYIDRSEITTAFSCVETRSPKPETGGDIDKEISQVKDNVRKEVIHLAASKPEIEEDIWHLRKTCKRGPGNVKRK